MFLLRVRGTAQNGGVLFSILDTRSGRDAAIGAAANRVALGHDPSIEVWNAAADRMICIVTRGQRTGEVTIQYTK